MKPVVYLNQVLREKLREASVEAAEKLSRSVTRVSSYEPGPCVEYGELVKSQCGLMNRVLSLQKCRSVLESSMAGKSVRLVFQVPGGRVIRTKFVPVSSGKTKVFGLEL